MPAPIRSLASSTTRPINACARSAPPLTQGREVGVVLQQHRPAVEVLHGGPEADVEQPPERPGHQDIAGAVHRRRKAGAGRQDVREVAPASASAARQARSTTSMRSAAGISGIRKLAAGPCEMFPRRSATAAVVVAAPMSMPRTTPARGFSSNRRAGRPFGWPDWRSASSSRSSPAGAGPHRRR